MKRFFLLGLFCGSASAAPNLEATFLGCVEKVSRDKDAARKFPFLMPLGTPDRLLIRGALLAPNDPKISRQYIFVHKGRIFVSEFPDVMGNSRIGLLKHIFDGF